jgi:TfoX/Sxy family transcriptional regulator of competence genes
MAFDTVLADRLREMLAPQGSVREIRMFGGLAFMLFGHMCVCVRDDEIYVRLGQEGVAEAIAAGEAQPFHPTGGKQAFGLATVPDAAALDDDDLEAWVRRSSDFVKTLPPKDVL